MTIFDLLFLVSSVSAVAALLAAAGWAIRGQGARAISILKRLAVAILAYVFLVAVVTAARPQRVFLAGEPWCFDDWCLSVENIRREPTSSGVAYRISLRVFSEAKRVQQRAQGAWLYLIDDRGRRYAPAPDAAAIPLDVLLQPGESVTTSRLFVVPGDAHRLGLIAGHGGRYCFPPAALIIGQAGCVFGKPDLVRIE